MLRLLLCALLTLSATTARSATWHINPAGTGDAPTIQAGIDSAAPGDSVVLGDGTFTGAGNREIDFSGKHITVTSLNGPSFTTVDCQALGFGFIFQNGEGPSAVLSNLAIENAAGVGFGSGVVVLNGSPTLTGLTISNCNAPLGGGITAFPPSFPTITGNTITGCSGGGIACAGPALVTGNIISDNTAENGAGIYVLSGGPEIVGNTICGNAATSGGGIYSGPGTTTRIEGNTICENTASAELGLSGGGVFIDAGSAVTIVDNAIVNNQYLGSSFGLGGGGIAARQANVTIENNLIQGNTGAAVGGVHVSSCIAIISSNRFYDNETALSLSRVSGNTPSVTTIDNCIFAGNYGATAGVFNAGGATTMSNCTVVENDGRLLFYGVTNADPFVIDHCIFAFNTLPIVPGDRCSGTSGSRCNDVFGNDRNDFLCTYGSGADFEADPLFCGIPGSRNYGLTTISPCAPANSPCGELVGALPVSCGPVATLFTAGEAQASAFSVTLSWDVETDDFIEGFVIYRAQSDGLFAAITERIPESSRSYQDMGVTADTEYRYRVVAVDRGGLELATADIDVRTGAAELALEQNVPNPFNPTTTISFTLPTATMVELVVYDARGARVRDLMSGRQPAGRQDILWDGRDANGAPVASGVYFYRLRAGQIEQTRKMVLLK